MSLSYGEVIGCVEASLAIKKGESPRENPLGTVFVPVILARGYVLA